MPKTAPPPIRRAVILNRSGKRCHGAEQVDVAFADEIKCRHRDQHCTAHREGERGIPLPAHVEERQHALRVAHTGQQQSRAE